MADSEDRRKGWEDVYVRKDVWQEREDRRDERFKDIKDDLTVINQRIDEIKATQRWVFRTLVVIGATLVGNVALLFLAMAIGAK